MERSLNHNAYPEGWTHLGLFVLVESWNSTFITLGSIFDVVVVVDLEARRE